MGQRASAPREESRVHNNQRSSTLGVECPHHRHGCPREERSENDSYLPAPPWSWGRSRERRRRFRVGARSTYGVPVDFQLDRVDEGFPDYANNSITQPRRNIEENDRSPTPFDTSEIELPQIHDLSPSPPPTPTPRRRLPSFSRLGARVLSRNMASTPASIDVTSDTAQEQSQRLFDDPSNSISPGMTTRRSRRRFSRLGYSSRHTREPAERTRIINSMLRRRDDDFPMEAFNVNRPWLHDSPHPEQDLGTRSEVDATAQSGSISSRRSRLSRVRNSLSLPLPYGLQNGRNRPSQHPDVSAFNRPRPTIRQSDSYTPRLPMPNLGDDIHVPRISSLFPSVSRPRYEMDTDDDNRSSSNDRHATRLPAPTRRSPQRVQQEDQAAMLSRLLSGAAAATAASLVGNTDRAFSEAHDVAGDGEDGSFDGFLQALQNGSLAAALRNGGSEMGGGSESTATDGGFAPVNFFRMFRFGSTGDNRGRSGESPENASDPSQNPDGGRLVPVIIVGIRSVTPTDSTGRDDGFITPPLFDAFSALPLGLPNGMPRGGSGTFMRRTDRAARFGRSRRASMGSVGSFPSNYDSQRHHRTGPLSSRSSPQSRPFFGSTLPTVLSDSPPGPHPPPSTPAEHGISAFSTGNNTPTRRPSSASVGSPMLTSSTQSTWREGSDARHASAGSPSVVEQPVTPTANPRRRRLSDSEFARYRDFGPGSSRRNGIVGDSDVGGGAARPHGGAQSEGTRSWIIYVLGGSYPEDHPILTTPSLFTDSPTYEDMLLLSSLLGPVKPPVATQEDVASAPGVYRVAGNANEPFAADISGERIELVPEGRCLVCLCDYELEEEVRRLNKCGHLYHRECIDTWLTTGRNSCPLCRSQGVGSEMSDAADTNEQPPTSTNPTIR